MTNTTTATARPIAIRLIAAAGAGATTLLVVASMVGIAGPQRAALMARTAAATQVAAHQTAPVALALQTAPASRGARK